MQTLKSKKFFNIVQEGDKDLGSMKYPIGLLLSLLLLIQLLQAHIVPTYHGKTMKKLGFSKVQTALLKLQGGGNDFCNFFSIVLYVDFLAKKKSAKKSKNKPSRVEESTPVADTDVPNSQPDEALPSEPIAVTYY